MDAHLVGIDLAELLPRHNANMERQRPLKATELTGETAVVGKDTHAEAH